MRYFEGSSSQVSGIDDHVAGHYRRVLAAVLAVLLLAGGLVGLLARTASATTSPVTLTMTSGTFGAHGNTPTALPTPATFSAHLNSSTGVFSAGTLTIPSWKESNTGSTETIHIFDVHSGTAKGSIDYHGNVTITDTVTVQVKITSPISETCNATPVHLTLQSTSPYNTTTKDVDLSDTTFSIPNFTTCGLAKTSLDSRFSGSSGNVLTLDVHGTLTEPPPPAVTSKTTLTTSPASPQLQGTSVTLSAAVKKTTGAAATTATGNINFYTTVTGTHLLSVQPVSSGTASYATSTLPPGTDKLKAVYSGNSTYNGSTSSTVSYVVQPKPSVAVSPTTISVTRGGSAATFSITLTNPSTGESWTHLWLRLRMNGISGQRGTKITLSYENSAHTWCPITLTGVKVITGTFKGTSGACSSATSFALAAGHSLTVPFEVSFAGTTNTGVETFVASLETVSGSTIVAPFTAATVTTVPVHGPYAKGTSPNALPTITVNPATKFTVTVGATPPSSATPKGYVVPVHPTVTAPATTTTTTIYYPSATGTVTFLVDGHVTATSPVKANTLVFTRAALSTATLTVGSHTLEVKYDGSSIYNAGHVTKTFTVTTAAPGTAFVCSSAHHATIVASVVASGTLPATSDTGKASATSVSVALHTDPNTGPNTTSALSTVSILATPGGGTTASGLTPTESGGITTSSWTGLTINTIPITGTVGSEVSVGIETINFVQSGLSYTCAPKTSAAHLGTVKVAAPPTPVTWSLAGCTSGSTTAPSWANTEKIVAKGAGGGGGGAAASATGYGGAGGAGGSVTTTFTISGSTTVSAKTGCAGKGAPQGSGVVGNGGASVSGWSASGKGGQGRYTAIGITHGNDGTGGSGGGSTGVCNGASTCTSATTAHVVTVASGGGGGGESMCSGTDAGSGGQAGNAGTTATSSSKGKGLSGTGGATGGTGGVAGGAGGANNKSTGSGSATGSAGGQGKEPVAGDGGGSGGGGAGYIGGAGGAPTADDCGAGGGGGGGASWVATAGGSTTFGTGASGGSRSGTTGTAGAVTVTFSYTKTR